MLSGLGSYISVIKFENTLDDARQLLLSKLIYFTPSSTGDDNLSSQCYENSLIDVYVILVTGI